MKDQLLTLHDVTRVEIIDEKGREYTRHNIDVVKLAVQDNGKTIKIFVSSKKDKQ
jgi:hypothetical protein